MAKKSNKKNKIAGQLSTMRLGHGLGAISDVPTFRKKINSNLGLSKKQSKLLQSYPSSVSVPH